MNQTILPVKPMSQLFPIPMIMGCEGVSASMMLHYNEQPVKATDIMKNWPTQTIHIKVMLVIIYLLNLAITKPFSQKPMFRFYKIQLTYH